MPVFTRRTPNGSKVVMRRSSYTSPMRKHGGDVWAKPAPGTEKVWTSPSTPRPIIVWRNGIPIRIIHPKSATP